jgi:hypothetical protein
LVFFSITKSSFSKNCNCETEFRYIKAFVEKNYAGFKDKQALMTPSGYKKMADIYLAFSKGPNSNEKCLLIISQFLDQFKDHHVSVGINFDPYKVDSAYLQQRQIIPISDARIAELRKSKTFEGIYDFHERALYKIAVIKDKTDLHDYVGIIISSNLPGWKKGMIKFEGKLISDSLAKGVLYIINHMPKQEHFYFGKDLIGGDWQREGTSKEKTDYKYEPVASKKLSEKTLYIKVSNFSPSNAANIDSILRVNEKYLKTVPYLVLDLRGNGGGADFAYMPLLPYLYTGSVSAYGSSLLSTDANVEGWKKYLEDKDLPEARLTSITKTIQQMENNKGKWVINSNDNVISNYTKLPYPNKVVILIDNNSASSTEQFLLFARQSSKVTFMGQNTSGTLDYSNVIEAPFSCMPYVLRYSSSRSRRLDHNQGIDDTGIKPDQYLSLTDDWIQKAMTQLEK